MLKIIREVRFMLNRPIHDIEQIILECEEIKEVLGDIMQYPIYGSDDYSEILKDMQYYSSILKTHLDVVKNRKIDQMKIP